MSDPRYPESAAYHEGGHVVVAAAQGMRLSRHGIHLDSDGRGISYYEYRKPKRWANITPEVTREHTIISTVAGLIAQRKFYPECSILGASEDNNLVDELLNEINEGDDIIGYRSLKAQLELRQESEKFVNEFWSAIEAVARALWATPEHTEGLQRARTGLVTVVDGKKTRWCALCRNSQALWDLPFDLG